VETLICGSEIITQRWHRRRSTERLCRRPFWITSPGGDRKRPSSELLSTALRGHRLARVLPGCLTRESVSKTSRGHSASTRGMCVMSASDHSSSPSRGLPHITGSTGGADSSVLAGGVASPRLFTIQRAWTSPAGPIGSPDSLGTASFKRFFERLAASSRCVSVILRGFGAPGSSWRGHHA
jgi:hypothetical protein